MRTHTAERATRRRKRHMRIRRKVSGTSDKPRLSIFRSLNHIFAQLIDDSAGQTLVSASTLSKEVRESVSGKPRKEASKAVGVLLAERAKAKGIEHVKFDRGGYLYHGRVRALAEGAREGGLKF
ncbi:MAG: 50S ribosomal protein L18 [Candidatus Eiseniibacteriota bacterium]|nr:MAG: 50S ribosomal protein L18 [Candidatus Eisenbacteria bacterium]